MNNSWKGEFALAIGLLWMLVCLPVLAGNTDSPAPPGDPTAHLPSFAEVCARLASGADPGAPPGSFVEPGGPPVDGPLCNLQDLMNMTPAPDNVAGATPDQVACGKAYWGLRTDGSWGLQAGNFACSGCELDCPVLFDVPNGFGQCQGGGPDCELVCCTVGSGNPACDGVFDYFDLNGLLTDGCEFSPDPDAIYVSESDPAAVDTSGCGTDPWLPCATISFGIGEAASTARTKVLVANGAYDESITVQDGISLLGGHRADTWERNVSATLTAIYGGGGGGSHRKTITVSGVSSTTTVEGFLVYGQQNVNASGNSYAVWIANTGTALSLINNRIIAGRGGDGTPGFAGAPGSFGTSGGFGSNSIQTTATTLSACNASPSTPGSGGSGGFRTCGATSVDGGDGGDAQCPNMNSQQSTGDNGRGAFGGAGGQGGYDRVAPTCGSFFTGGLPAEPDPGAKGQDGFDGSGGLGCSTPGGFVSSNEWLGSSGTSGVGGAHGGGGGGGGAGGGADRGDGCSGDGDALGGSGGGGGSGGCAGSVGGSGTSGGGSFGVFVSFSAPSALFPTITGNLITAGLGGNGGNGGPGGTGGEGGDGGSGGTVSGTWAFAMGNGGDGGDGGRGGSAGGGGGACGGVAYGVYTHNISGSPTYASANTFNPGDGGNAGAGGASLGSAGTSGAAGSSGDVN